MKRVRQFAAIFPAVISLTFIFVMSHGGVSQVAESSAGSEQQLIQSRAGRDLFVTYCASCHGADAKGHGAVAAELKTKVPDLTQITNRNLGVFPRERVRNTIDSEARPAAHGTRAMPVWGPFFSRIESDTDFGKVRVDNMVLYLESLQARAPTTKTR
jgi:mono/diheme cytochrome c family protein